MKDVITNTWKVQNQVICETVENRANVLCKKNTLSNENIPYYYQRIATLAFEKYVDNSVVFTYVIRGALRIILLVVLTMSELLKNIILVM
jgi:hypothetical protein